MNFYNYYGTIVWTYTTLSFTSTNVFIDTTQIIGGYVFVTSCNTAVDNVINEVMINNLTMDGPWTTLFLYGGVYMTGTQNFTITNSYFGSYGYMFDAKQLVRGDSPLNCNPNDGVPQKITITNTIFNMSKSFTGTPHHGFILSFLQWYNRQNMTVTFSNNIMINIQQSFYRPLLLDAIYA